MKGFISVTRTIAGVEVELIVHYTTVYREGMYWKHDGKSLNITDEEIKELIKKAQ